MSTLLAIHHVFVVALLVLGVAFFTLAWLALIVLLVGLVRGNPNARYGRRT